MKIAVLGAGAFGMALGGILADKGHRVYYYDPKIKDNTLDDALSNAEYILLCIPSSAVPYLLPNLPKDKPLMVATKGILTDKIFDDFSDYMILSGPGFAADIVAKKHICLTATDDRIIDLFDVDYISFDKTNDRRGILICGALKNVYAIKAGMLNLTHGSTEWNSYIGAVLDEMREILKLNGAKAETVDLYCGKGDLELTCNLPSRNYEFGQMLRKDSKSKPEKTVEGVSALKQIRKGELVIPDSAKILLELMEKSKEWD